MSDLLISTLAAQGMLSRFGGACHAPAALLRRAATFTGLLNKLEPDEAKLAGPVPVCEVTDGSPG